MRDTRFSRLLIAVLLLTPMVWSDSAHSVRLQGSSQDIGPAPIVIHSQTLEADDRKGTVVFKGNVEAKRVDFTLNCQTMVIY